MTPYRGPSRLADLRARARWALLRRPEPGKVEISQQEWLRLLEQARRTEQLEAENAHLAATQARLQAELRACELISETQSDAPRAALDSQGLLAALPYDAEGALHEPAFRGLLLDRLLDPRFATVQTSPPA